MNTDINFQKIEEDNEMFNPIEENVEEDSGFINAFVMGLPDWDLEPLYETIKRSDK